MIYWTFFFAFAAELWFFNYIRQWKSFLSIWDGAIDTIGKDFHLGTGG